MGCNYILEHQVQLFVAMQKEILSNILGSWPHIKQIPGTSLLISTNHFYTSSANFEIIDFSNLRYGTKASRFAFEEVRGGRKLLVIFAKLHHVISLRKKRLEKETSLSMLIVPLQH